MKFFRNHKKAGVAGLALTVAVLAGGAAFAYFTTSGSGNGSATVANGASIKIEPLTTSTAAYDSLYSPLPANVVSQSYEATGTAEYGNQIALAGGTGQTLSTVVQTMDSWTCGNWVAQNAAIVASATVPTCATTSGTSFNEPITLNVYSVGAGNAVGSLITSDTQTFAIPFRPSASGTCPVGYDNGEWADGSGNCHNGLAFNITFNVFHAAVLPANVIFSIAYSTGSAANGGNGAVTGNAAASLNVGLTTEPTEPTVGADPLTGSGSDYISITTANGGGSGGGYDSNYCDKGAGGYVGFRYDPGPCVAGSSAINAPPSSTNYVPATEFNMVDGGTIDLYPGGPSQAVDFSITNSSSTPALIQGVTFAILTSDLPAGCNPGWFTLTQPTTSTGYTVPANSTVDFTGSGGLITLGDSGGNQDACENVSVPLVFTSN